MHSENEALIERSRHLINISRFDEAIRNLRQVLANEQENYDANLLLAFCLYNQQKYNESFEYTGRLIRIAPDTAVPFYYHALNYAGLRDFTNAEKFADEAIRLDPYDADCWSLKSWLYIIKNKWQEALDYAEQGLRSDPEHIQLLNNKSTCLIKLGKTEQLAENVKETLSQDPDNYYSHANAGWIELERGNYKQAKAHFMESLRLQPANEPARNGVIQTLKARNWFFRIFLRYYFWIGKHQSYAQWGIVIGIYLGGRGLRALSESYPALLPLSVGFSVLVYLTWIINPLFNLFLRLDPLGKHVLNKQENISAAFVGTGLLAALLCLGCWLITDVSPWLFTALFFASVLIPISNYYELQPYQNKTKVGWLTGGIALTGIVSLALLWTGIETGFTFLTVYFILIWLYGWLANFLIMR